MSEPLELTEEKIKFRFDAGMVGKKWDGSVYYLDLKKERRPPSVDIVAVEEQAVAWLIEVKDFRIITTPPKPANNQNLPETMARKVNGALSTLAEAAHSADKEDERLLAQRGMATPKRRVALHLEPYRGNEHSGLSPKGFPSIVLKKLKQIPTIKAIDENQLVLNIATTQKAGVPWVARDAGS